MKMVSNVGGGILEKEHCKKCGTRLAYLQCGAAKYCPGCEMVLDYVLGYAYPKALEKVEDCRD